jgi:hypothetical protein
MSDLGKYRSASDTTHVFFINMVVSLPLFLFPHLSARSCDESLRLYRRLSAMPPTAFPSLLYLSAVALAPSIQRWQPWGCTPWIPIQTD